ncbi:UNVERIFIED_CONTAM: microcystin-dependent protein [Brevibacillus sp. OAP136]
MADAYVGEIRIFAGAYAPSGWAFCDGSLIPIRRNPALFSIIGVQYGGDGQLTFALPDLRGRAAMHQGAGPGLTPRSIGAPGGSSTVTLTQDQMPAHNHLAECDGKPTTNTPSGTIWTNTVGRGSAAIYAPLSNPTTTTLNPQSVAVTGSSLPHNNKQPYLGMNFIICLEGEFPPRS